MFIIKSLHLISLHFWTYLSISNTSDLYTHSELPKYFSYSIVLEVMNPMVQRRSVHHARQAHFHLMGHHAKHVLMEATVFKEQQNVLSAHLDISKHALMFISRESFDCSKKFASQLKPSLILSDTFMI